MVREQYGGNGKAGAEGFRGGNHVRRDAIHIRGKRVTGAADTALHFVENQQRTHLRATMPQRLQEFLRHVHGARDALDRFDDYRRRVVSNGDFERLQVAAWDELDIEGRARTAIPFFLRAPSYGAGRRGPPVKTAFHGDDFLHAGDLERDLQRVLVRFGARVDEEH